MPSLGARRGTPARLHERAPHLLGGDGTVAAEVMIENTHVLPTRRTDPIPAVGVFLELGGVLGMHASVILDSDAPADVREVDLRDEVSPSRTKNPVDLGLGEREPAEHQTEQALARRSRPDSHKSECLSQKSPSDIPHLFYLFTQLGSGREGTLPRHQEITGGNKGAQRPRHAGLPPRADGMFDAKTVGSGGYRRFARLEAVPCDARRAGFARRPMGGYMYAGPIRPLGHGCAHDRKRCLMAEELPGRESRGVLEATGAQLVI